MRSGVRIGDEFDVAHRPRLSVLTLPADIPPVVVSRWQRSEYTVESAIATADRDRLLGAPVRAVDGFRALDDY